MQSLFLPSPYKAIKAINPAAKKLPAVMPFFEAAPVKRGGSPVVVAVLFAKMFVTLANVVGTTTAGVVYPGAMVAGAVGVP